MSFLEDKIRKASQAYYSGKDSGMSDEEFDKCMNKYIEEEPDGELINKVGHGYDVKLDDTPGEKLPHKYGKVGSLKKAYVWKEFDSFISSENELHMSLKLDGLSVVLYFVKGKLTLALTRGDGVIGIDITKKIQFILNHNIVENAEVILKDKTFTGAVRGEILMSKANFAEYKKLFPELKNPRNAAAGLINAKDSYNPNLLYLKCVVYRVIGTVSSCCPKFPNMHSISAWLQNNFEYTVPEYYECLNESNYLDVLNSLNAKWSELGWPSDGIVLTDIVVSHNKFNVLDIEIEYISQAFKFQSEVAESKVIDVEWNMTKHRRAMPTVVIEPVELAGTIVQRATGYNAKYILDSNIGRGATVEVEKHGEIIPNINKVIHGTTSDMITNCLDCGELLSWHGVDLMCTNPNCNNAIMQDTICWIKNLAPVDGLGDSLIAKFLLEVNTQFNGYGHEWPTVDDLMTNDYLSVETNMSGKQFDKFKTMLKKLYSDTFSIKSAILAINIPRLGEVKAAMLENHPDVLLHAIDIDVSVLQNVLGVADMESIKANVSKFLRLQYISSRINWGAYKSCNERSEVIPVAITGKISVPRKKFQAELESYGFKLGELKKSTKYLITDDPNSNSAKNKNADAWNIIKITESEFREKFMK